MDKNSIDDQEIAILPPLPNSRETKAKVMTYLRRLGFSGDPILYKLAESCVRKSHLKLGNYAPQPEKNRRALDEVNRRYSHWLKRVFQLKDGGNNEIQELKAAILLNPQLNAQLRYGEKLSQEQKIAALTVTPKAVPKESPLAMPKHKLDFVFLKSAE